MRGCRSCPVFRSKVLVLKYWYGLKCAIFTKVDICFRNAACFVKNIRVNLEKYDVESIILIIE